jgi:hypothetical protein
MAVVSLSAGVGVPGLLLGLEDGLEDGVEPGFNIAVKSVVDEEGATCGGMAKLPDG